MYYVIADLHGRLDLLQSCLKIINEKIQSDDKIIFLGDYIDRGSNSAQVVDTLISLQKENSNVICLKGNHEQMFEDSFYGDAEPFYDYPSRNSYFLTSFEDDDLTIKNKRFEVKQKIKVHKEWFESLPYFYETENYFFVHAGLRPNFNLDQQSKHDMIWIRWEFLSFPFDFGKHVVHGHTPNSEQNVELMTHRTNLDCRSYKSNKQAIGIFDEKVTGPIEILYVGVDGIQTHFKKENENWIEL